MLLLFSQCSPSDPDAPSPETLQSLVKQHVTRTHVESILGKGYAWYQKGTPSWDDFRSPTNELPNEVQDAGNKYAKLMFYTTMWQRTWIFLDEDDRVQAYFTGSQ